MDDEFSIDIERKPMDVPAEMVMEIAAGMEEPFAIAYRYGYTYEQFAALTQWKPFNMAVEAKKVELQKSGHTFRLMTGWMAEDLAKKLYVQAKSNDASLPQVHEVFKTMAKLADYEPKQAVATQAAGEKFSVNIILNAPAEPKNIVIEAEKPPETPDLPPSDAS